MGAAFFPMLPGCCILAHHDRLRPLAGSGCPVVQQHPRYVAAKKNMPVHFICYSQEPHNMQWYKTAEDSDDLYGLDHSTSRYSIERKDNLINFTIFRITYEDNGIYVCDSKNLTAEKKQPQLCATELRVMGEWDLPILCAPQEMLFLLLSPFPPPYEPDIVLLCTYLSPCWWDPFKHNCRCSIALQRFLCLLTAIKQQDNLPQFALACPSYKNTPQGLHFPNKSDFSWS